MEELPPNTKELPPIIQDMLDQGELDDNDIIGVLAAIPMIDDDNEPAIRIFHLLKISWCCPTMSWAHAATAAFANGNEGSNAMPTQNLPSGLHPCLTHPT